MRLDLTWRWVAVWQRNMLVFRRFLLSNVVLALVEPLVMVVGMGFGVGRFVEGIGGGVSYAAFVAPGAIASTCMYVATKAAINGTTVLAAVLLFRMVPGVTPLMVFIPLVAFLGGLLFSAIGLLITSVATNNDHFNYFITLGLTPMFVFSGIFFPIEALPEYAANLAWFTPLMHMVRLSRELALARPAHVWADLLWLSAATLALLPWPFVRLRRRLVR